MSDAVTTQIKEYSATEAGLAELRQEYEGRVFDVTTTAGDKEAREARQKLVKLRTALEAKRKEIKAPALAYAQAIDTEAKRITAEIKKLEEPIDAQIKAEEQRKQREKEERERQERERVAAIRAKIDAIRLVPVESANDTAEQLQATYDDLKGYTATEEEFAEFKDEAAQVIQSALANLGALLESAKRREEEATRLAAERAAQEAEARRIAEQRAELERQQQEIARQRAELEAASKPKDTPPAYHREDPVGGHAGAGSSFNDLSHAAGVDESEFQAACRDAGVEWPEGEHPRVLVVPEDQAEAAAPARGTPTVTLRFEGYSDDTFGETLHTRDDYDTCASGKPIRYLVTHPDVPGGVYVVGQHGRNDLDACWSIAVAPFDPNHEDLPLPDWPMSIVRGERPYSPALIIEAPAGVDVVCLERKGDAA